jgi:thiol-disulfide isomerase/thioredoxin
MIRFCFSFLLLLLLLIPIASNAQKAQLYSFSEAEQYWKNKHADTLLIVNFWATWCKPCVAELPYFEQIQQEFAQQKVKVILLSLDYPDVLKSRVIPFIQKKKLKSEVWLMNESNPNDWIDAVDSGWSGAIPATLIVKPDGTYAGFYEESLDYLKLKTIIQPLLP